MLAAPGDLNYLRVDQVGSLLRPAILKEAWARHGEGKASDDELRQTQDAAIRAIIARQEAIGYPILTDGEFRRLGFQDSLAAAVSGMNLRTAPSMAKGTPGSRGEDPTFDVRVPAAERLRLDRNLPLEEYQFAQALTSRPVKVTLIGPGRVMQRFDPDASQGVYEDVDDFVSDVVAVERQIIQSLVEAGCRYISIDEPSYTAYVDPTWIAAMRARGEDPARNLDRAIQADNALMSDFPGVTFGVHVCRGNRQSMYHREGHYDAIAERLFSGLDAQRLLLEYDTERAGDFAPLRYVPRGKIAVLGLVSTKFADLEDTTTLQRRLDEASQILPLDQLALSPQCGFASSLAGNQLAEADQWRKLERVREVADQVWR
jgi:5-methyltetrahydropteroyltriglutamate--homocysteine methyltransferase